MERNAGLTFLVGIFAIATLVAVVVIFMYVRTGGQMRRVQAQITQIQNQRAMMQSLGNDVLEYSKTHPAVAPILQPIMSPQTATNPSK